MLDILLLSVVLLSDAALGIIVYFNNPKAKTNLVFALFTLTVIVWTLSSFLENEFSSSATILILGKIDYTSALFIAFFFLNFALLFTSTTNRYLKFTEIPLLVIVTFISYLICLTDKVIARVTFFGDNFHFDSGSLSLLYDISLVIILGLGALVLARKVGTSRGINRTQTIYVLIGFFLSIITGIVTNVLLPEVFTNNPPILTRIGIYSLLFLTSFTAYAIVKHKLLDIRLVIARSIAYTLLVVLIAAFYTGATFTFSNLLLKESYQTNQLIISTVLTLIVAFTFQPLRRTLEKATDNIFFKDPYDPQTLLGELTRIMAKSFQLKELSLQLLDRLMTDMKISRAAFILVTNGKIFAVESRGFTEVFLPHEKEIFSLQSQNQMLLLENLPEGPLKETMRRYNLNLSLPLKTGKDEIGLLVLGEKSSGEIYSEQDLNVLNIFSSEVSVAIQNAKSYEEIKRFNITLKEEVDRATKELQVANERLRELDKLKDEFISVTSHDLRTPLTAIKSYLWLAIHGKAGQINEKMNFYLGRSYQSAERMLALISDLLDVSRIERGKIELHLEPADLSKVVEMVLDELRSNALEKNIKLEMRFPKEPLPEVMLDQERFPEIITNLVGNALKFTPEKGSVAVSAALSNNMVEVSVTDTGVGISKDDMPKLFSKFGRLDNSYKAVATTGGTGLGLYITKNLVQLHGGQINVLSQIGKGTTFAFTLRIATDEEKKAKKYIPAPQGVIINPELMGQFKVNENHS